MKIRSKSEIKGIGLMTPKPLINKGKIGSASRTRTCDPVINSRKHPLKSKDYPGPDKSRNPDSLGVSGPDFGPENSLNNRVCSRLCPNTF